MVKGRKKRKKGKEEKEDVTGDQKKKQTIKNHKNKKKITDQNKMTSNHTGKGQPIIQIRENKSSKIPVVYSSVIVSGQIPEMCCGLWPSLPWELCWVWS